MSVTVAQIGTNALVLDTCSRSNIAGAQALNRNLNDIDRADLLTVK